MTPYSVSEYPQLTMHPHPALLGSEKYESSFGVLGSKLIMILKHTIHFNIVSIRLGQQFTY